MFIKNDSYKQMQRHLNGRLIKITHEKKKVILGGCAYFEEIFCIGFSLLPDVLLCSESQTGGSRELSAI